MRLTIFLIVLFTSFKSYSQNSPTIKNLVFEGGGVRGLAYAGALMTLNENKMLDSVERVAGTSAGAIAATLYAVGYQPKEILDLISNLNIKDFADGHWFFIGGSRRFIKKFGWYRGEKFKNWIGALIKEKTGKEEITFRELYELSKSRPDLKQLYLTGTNLSLQRPAIFCHETFPEMEVRTAVRISISIPFFFQAVFIDQQGKELSGKDIHQGYVMVDGGIVANYPIQIFDYQKYVNQSSDSSLIINTQTLGMRLDHPEQIEYDKMNKGLAPIEIKKTTDFTNAFYRIVNESINRQSLKKEDWQRTISISTGGIGPKIKKIPLKDINLLVEKEERELKNI